ncbi:Exonuclease [Cynara cardunculus var. scolymus]|uniref:Exonuclease n=1 Tax=Cynara cardunculus var. scolymus TaxID=59895 RepID=A0A103XLC6_CYNCS|nr:Exonuclease [Cynara cardunculus var. scolymus]
MMWGGCILLNAVLSRNKCAACYRQFNKKEHLVEHMRVSYHSVHEPMCGICGKRCRSFESLRDHLIVALAGKMVGGGSDGSLDLCARVCIIDEYENILFHSYVKPQLPVTNYRYETTGIRPEYLRDAMPVRQVQRKIQDFLCNGEPIWKIRPRGERARILIGHGLDHEMKCLELDYEIQNGIQDPYDDCVATMRLYRRMRSQAHQNYEDYPLATDSQNKNNFGSWRQGELERMSPEELMAISRSDYYCWCLDGKE